MRNRFPATQKVTIADVAARAGVSKGTVSKVLGGGEYYVADETRERISAAVAELDFRPNAIARGLKRRRSQTIGVIVASIANPLYAELISGVEEALAGSEYTLIFGSSEGSAQKEMAVVRSMQQRQVDGIVMASVTLDDGEVEKQIEAGLNVVLASRNLARVVADAVVSDNHAGATAAVEHLAEHGHKRIGHISGPQDVVPFAQRRAAYDETLSRLSLETSDELCVIATATSLEAGADAAIRLLDSHNPPTAVFVGSDGLALGVLDACAKSGVRVPEDLAIVGFDNIWVGRMPGIGLSTVETDARRIGRRAAERLIERIDETFREGAWLHEPEVEVLPATLVARRTCGCPGD
ncbi:LacI family DNA-binding transcriptional regulator [Nocardioides zeicaulis]|uniref:LacI family DNA-binding transcriptional regulator n=1 Tax=Nocardioides zeicaulis TaxID=1776857 RepID=A0ABV6DWS0_9ACTN